SDASDAIDASIVPIAFAIAHCRNSSSSGVAGINGGSARSGQLADLGAKYDLSHSSKILHRLVILVEIDEHWAHAGMGMGHAGSALEVCAPISIRAPTPPRGGPNPPRRLGGSGSIGQLTVHRLGQA